MKKILHISIDDKFIDSAIWQFEQIFPGSNKFYILNYNNAKTYKFIKMQSNCELIALSEESLIRILHETKEYNLIVFHGLHDFCCEIVLRSEKKLNILWSFWGFEVYNYHKYFINNIYGNETTRKFMIKRPETLTRRLANLYNGTTKFYKKNRRFRAISKISHFGFPYKEEFTLLNELKLLNSDYVRFTYYPLEFIIKEHENTFVSGNNILLGNSATMSNNHLEIFEILAKIDLNWKKVIVPLSYGDNDYRDEILKIGSMVLPAHFEPLTKFYPLEEYNEIIRTCNIFIMNSYRQQGIGNVFAMLWMGAKVYLDERNTTYQYLKRINCSVFSIAKDLNPLNYDVFTPLSLSEIKRNREILRKELGKEKLLIDLKNQIETIIKN